MIALYLTGVDPEKRALAIRAVKAALVAAGMENGAEAFQAAEQAVMAVLRTEQPCALITATVGDPLPGQIYVTEAQVNEAAMAFEAAVADTGCAEAYTVEHDGGEGRRIPQLPEPKADQPERPSIPSDDEGADEDTPTGKRRIPINERPVDRDEARVAALFMSEVPEDFAPSRKAAASAALLMAMCNGSAQGAFLYARRLAHTTGDVDLWAEVAHVLGDALGFKVATL